MKIHLKSESDNYHKGAIFKLRVRLKNKPILTVTVS